MFHSTEPGALGTYAGGEFSDQLGLRDARWYLRLPALTSVAKIPLALLFLFWSGGVPPVLLYGCVLFLSAVYAAPTWAISFAGPSLSRRASSELQPATAKHYT